MMGELLGHLPLGTMTQELYLVMIKFRSPKLLIVLIIHDVSRDLNVRSLRY